MSNTKFGALLFVSAVNMAATTLVAYTMWRAATQVEAEVDELKEKTNKTLGNLRNALQDLEV
jgi:hypothetical protein